jgi:hypothetical protein
MMPSSGVRSETGIDRASDVAVASNTNATGVVGKTVDICRGFEEKSRYGNPKMDLVQAGTNSP